MKPVCMIVLLVTALVCNAADKPALERAGENLPIIEMPLAKNPTPMKRLDAPLSKKIYPPDTDVAVEGKFEVADPKDFKPFRMIVRFSVKDKPGKGWKTITAHRGREPVKVKEGLYRYRTVIRTPQEPGIYFVHIYNHEQFCMSLARVDVDEDAE